MSNFLKEVLGVSRATAMALTDLPSIANNTFLGNISGSAATPSALTATQVTANLNQFTSSLQGLVPGSGGGTTNFLRADGTWAPTGTVTSVALSVPSFLSVSGSPVTTTGTLAVTLATESANTVFAGPSSGSAATPTFRALTVADQTITTQALGTVTTTKTIDWSTGYVFTVTLTSGDTCTFSFSNASSGQTIVVEITNGSSGGTGVVTWPTVKWPGGTAPVQTVGTAALDVYTFVYNGSFYVGSAVQNLS